MARSSESRPTASGRKRKNSLAKIKVMVAYRESLAYFTDMTDGPENLILEQLRLIRADVADIKRVQGDQGHVLEQHTVTLREHTQTLDGLLSIMGAIHSRLSRVEKHLGLVDA